MATSRKVFQIIVDETAFTTNISEIKKWLTHGAITVYVPLYTLECLRILKKEHNQVGTNAREALRFLDRVTSDKDNTSIDKVTVEGPLDVYASWAEVMEQLLPEFQQDAEPGQEEDSPKLKPVNGDDTSTDGPLALSQELLAKLNFRPQPVCSDHSANGASGSPSSTHSNNAPANNSSDSNDPKPVAKTTTSGPVPKNLRPFLNAAIWRVAHQPVTTSCVLLTNSPECRDWAQMFGLPVKNIHQLRTAITYEDKESKNQNKYLEKNLTPAPSAEPKTMLSYENAAHGSDEEEITFVPRGRGKSLKANGQGSGTSTNGGTPRANGRRSVPAPAAAPRSSDLAPSSDVSLEPIDPNSFRRDIGPTKTSSTSPKQVELGSQAGAARGSAGARSLFNGNLGRANKENSGRGGGRNGHHGSRRQRENGHGSNGKESNGNEAGGSNHRGANGFRGSGRGKGTLFVP